MIRRKRKRPNTRRFSVPQYEYPKPGTVLADKVVDAPVEVAVTGIVRDWVRREYGSTATVQESNYFGITQQVSHDRNQGLERRVHVSTNDNRRQKQETMALSKYSARNVRGPVRLTLSTTKYVEVDWHHPDGETEILGRKMRLTYDVLVCNQGGKTRFTSTYKGMEPIQEQ